MISFYMAILLISTLPSVIRSSFKIIPQLSWKKEKEKFIISLKNVLFIVKKTSPIHIHLHSFNGEGTIIHICTSLDLYALLASYIFRGISLLFSINPAFSLYMEQGVDKKEFWFTSLKAFEAEIMDPTYFKSLT